MKAGCGEWVAVKDTGTVTAVAVVHEPLARLHPSLRGAVDRPWVLAFWHGTQFSILAKLQRLGPLSINGLAAGLRNSG